MAAVSRRLHLPVPTPPARRVREAAAALRRSTPCAADLTHAPLPGPPPALLLRRPGASLPGAKLPLVLAVEALQRHAAGPGVAALAATLASTRRWLAAGLPRHPPPPAEAWLARERRPGPLRGKWVASGGHAVTLEGRLRRFETEAAAAAVPVHQQRHGTAAAVVAADMAAGTRQNVAAWHLRRLLAQLGRAVHGPRAEALAPPLLPPTATTTAWAAAASQLKVAAAAAVDVVVRTRTHARHCLCPPCHRTRRPTGCPAPQACDGDGSGTVASALVALVEAQLVAVAAAAAAALELCQIVRPAGNSAAASTLRFAQAQLTGLQRLRLPPALQRRSALAATSVQAALEALEVPTVPGPGAAGPRVALLQAVAAAAATAAASILPATVVAGGCQLLDVTTCYRTPRMRWQHNASALAATA